MEQTWQSGVPLCAYWQVATWGTWWFFLQLVFYIICLNGCPLSSFLSPSILSLAYFRPNSSLNQAMYYSPQLTCHSHIAKLFPSHEPFFLLCWTIIFFTWYMSLYAVGSATSLGCIPWTIYLAKWQSPKLHLLFLSVIFVPSCLKIMLHVIKYYNKLFLRTFL